MSPPDDPPRKKPPAPLSTGVPTRVEERRSARMPALDDERGRDARRDYRTPAGGVPAPASPPESWEEHGYVETGVSTPRTISSDPAIATIERRSAENKNISINTLHAIGAVRTEMYAEMQTLKLALVALQEQNKAYSAALVEVAAERRQAQAALQEMVTAMGMSRLRGEEKERDADIDNKVKGAEVKRTITLRVALALIGAITTIGAAIAYLFGRGDK